MNGYVVWGGPPPMGPIDGSIVPCAAGGSIPFLSSDCIAVLRNIQSEFPKAWQRYSFVDAFNPFSGWYDTDVIGIDFGHHDADGGEPAYRLRLEHIHEEP